MALPYDAERLGQLRKMPVEARKRKLSAGLKAKPQRIGDDANRPEQRTYFPPTSTMTRISDVPAPHEGTRHPKSECVRPLIVGFRLV